MKWINAEQQVTVSIYDDELDKIMTVEEMLDTYTNEGCPTIYSNPEQAELNSSYNSIKTDLEPCEDCISREAVIRLAEQYPLIIGSRCSGLIADIKHLPSVTPKTEWFPVSERLPKAGEYVEDVARYYLVQNEYGDMLVARYTHSGHWEQIYQLKPIGDEIVAWMPLPQPYKESEE